MSEFVVEKGVLKSYTGNGKQIRLPDDVIEISDDVLNTFADAGIEVIKMPDPCKIAVLKWLAKAAIPACVREIHVPVVSLRQSMQTETSFASYLAALTEGKPLPKPRRKVPRFKTENAERIILVNLTKVKKADWKKVCENALYLGLPGANVYNCLKDKLDDAAMFTLLRGIVVGMNEHIPAAATEEALCAWKPVEESKPYFERLCRLLWFSSLPSKLVFVQSGDSVPPESAALLMIMLLDTENMGENCIPMQMTRLISPESLQAFLNAYCYTPDDGRNTDYDPSLALSARLGDVALCKKLIKLIKLWEGENDYRGVNQRIIRSFIVYNENEKVKLLLQKLD